MKLRSGADTDSSVRSPRSRIRNKSQTPIKNQSQLTIKQSSVSPKKKSQTPIKKKRRTLVKKKAKTSTRKKTKMHNVKLPNEIWLNVFDNLDYFSFKTVAKVNRQFKAFVDHASFDTVLHRNLPAVKSSGIRVGLHPILFEFCSCEGKNPTMANIEQGHRIGGRSVALNEIQNKYEPFNTELVTEPAVPMLQLFSGNRLQKCIFKETGVTVHDLLRAYCGGLKDFEGNLTASGGWTLREKCVCKAAGGSHEKVEGAKCKLNLRLTLQIYILNLDAPFDYSDVDGDDGIDEED